MNTWREEYRKKRIRRYSAYFSGIFEEGDQVLDIGSYNAEIMDVLGSSYPIEIRGLDIITTPEACDRVMIYDGKIFPFKDKCFDWVTIISTLHHIKDISAILKESKRVARKGIIIVDTCYNSLYEQIIVNGNELANISKRMYPPYYHRNERQFKEAFGKAGLIVSSKESFKVNKLCFSFFMTRWILKELKKYHDFS